MKGSVRKRGSTWSYRIDLGRMDGKRNQIEKGGFRTKREADKALTDALYQFNNTGDYVENQKITLSEVYAEFMEKEAEVTRAYATILAESGVSPRYVQDALGHSKLEFTLRYYTHVTEKMGNAVRNALESTVTFKGFEI